MSLEKSSVLVVTGETSGENHAAALIGELRRLIPERDFHFYGSGGEAMREEGVELLTDVRDLAAIGPLAALKQGPHYLRLFRRIWARCRKDRPDLAILVDFPDFNLPLARRLKRLEIPVCYFISPQLWAWRQSRVKQIRRNVDLMLVIFPFEEDFFRECGVAARYVGNPTATRLQEKRFRDRQKSDRQIVALLPGSRRKEVQLILPIQLDAAAFMSEQRDLEFWIQKAPSIERSFIQSVIDDWKKSTRKELAIEIRNEGSSETLGAADCALVKSGTSTLEAMLLGVPFAMIYRLSSLNWLSLRPFVAATQYCLANWVAGKRIVPEFVQHGAKGDKIGRFLLTILTDAKRRDEMKQDLRKAAARLGEKRAPVEAARIISEKFFAGDLK